MNLDTIYLKKDSATDFSFDEKISNVFDDMVSRSVPLYEQAQELIVIFIKKNIQTEASVYDLGCATGNTLFLLNKHLDDKHKLIGIDISKPMIEIAKEKALNQYYDSNNIILIEQDICTFSPSSNTGCFILNLTLQFIRPLKRQDIINNLYNNLQDNGIVIIYEKLVENDSYINRLLIDMYYDVKRENSYSEIEISKKREELENVLIPYTEEENKQLLKNAGFKHVTTIFRYLNFGIIVGIK